jgi:hypothetical protein
MHLRHRVATPVGDCAAILNAVADLVAFTERETGQIGTGGIATPGATSPGLGVHGFGRMLGRFSGPIFGDSISTSASRVG